MYIHQFYDAAIIPMPLKTFYVSFFLMELQCDMILICFYIQLLYTAFFLILTVFLPDTF